MERDRYRSLLACERSGRPPNRAFFDAGGARWSRCSSFDAGAQKPYCTSSGGSDSGPVADNAADDPSGEHATAGGAPRAAPRAILLLRPAAGCVPSLWHRCRHADDGAASKPTYAPPSLLLRLLQLAARETRATCEFEAWPRAPSCSTRMALYMRRRFPHVASLCCAMC